MATLLPLVIHERRNVWARQIRPRAAPWPVRLVESRSAGDLEAACLGSACPILVLDFGERPLAGLSDLEHALRMSPNLLSLVLLRDKHQEVAAIARELGATHVHCGRVTPPTVLRLLERWMTVAARRAEADGWANEFKPDLEPWEALLAEDLGTPSAHAGSPRNPSSLNSRR